MSAQPKNGAARPSTPQRLLALLCAVAVASLCLPPLPATASPVTAQWRNPAQTFTDSPETYSSSTLTRDSDGFFAALSGDGQATFASKIALSDLAKLGISFERGGKVAQSGGGSYKSPARWGSTNGANFSYSTLCTITVDASVFDRAAQLTYANNNGETVSYNKRDTIQAVLYAIGQTTQAAGFDGKTMYQVYVDYNGVIDLTNGLFVYSNTWLRLSGGTVLKKQYQSAAVSSGLADRDDARRRQIGFTNEGLLRNTAGEYGAGAYGQSAKIIIDGGTWDANIAQYNRAALGDKYQSSLSTFTHMKNLVIENATFLGNNLAHHIELSGVRDVTVTNCRIAQDDGAYASESIQIETLHSKGGTRESAPYDDTISRDVVVYANTFENLSRGVGNHSEVLGHDSSRIFVYKNTFRTISSQAVLTCGCRTMRIEGNTMKDVRCGVDVRVTWEDGPLNFSFPKDENWTYAELADDGLFNRNIKIVSNKIAVKDFAGVDALESDGSGIFVKGETLAAADLGNLKKSAGVYTITGVTVKGNTVSSALGEAIYLAQTKGVSVSKNEVKDVSAAGARAKGLYAENSESLTVTGNTLSGVQGQGICLAGKSPSSSVAKNKVEVTTKDVAVYASRSSLPATIAGNRLTVRGADAVKAPKQSVRAVTIKKKGQKGIAGASAPLVKLQVYAGTKKVGAAKTDKKGAFEINFKKKLRKKTAISLRYTDRAKNSVRFETSV